MPDALIGQVLDRRYRIDERIGSGAMGVVYRATHVLIGKTLAVKVLRPEHLANANVVERFLREAQLASSIKHQNVVDLSDYGELDDGGAYYVMEYLEGHTLAKEIDNVGRLDPKRALQLAMQIAQGLGAAHGRGIVHRDLKADNVFLCGDPQGEETVKLLDFGIARASDSSLTTAGSVLGTPEYMSPEQAEGEEVDHRSDLYSLGIIVFEMLTGRVPFRGTTLTETLTQQMVAPAPALADREPSLAALERTQSLVDRLMAKPRAERPAGALDVVRMIADSIRRDLAGGEVEEPARPVKSTVQLGSNSMQDDPPEPGPAPDRLRWAAPSGSPGAPAGDIGDDVADAQDRPPLPLVFGGAAVVAALATFGVLRFWGVGAEPEGEIPAGVAAGAAVDAAAGAVADPDADSVPNGAEPGTDPAADPGTADPNPSPIAPDPPTLEPEPGVDAQDAAPVTDVSTADVPGDRSEEADRRTKRGAKFPRGGRSKGSPQSRSLEPTPTPATPNQAPNANPEPIPPPKKRSRFDLKDPFSSN